MDQNGDTNGINIGMSKAQLRIIMPEAHDSDIEHYLGALRCELGSYQINTPLRLAHFITQVAYQSSSLRCLSDDLYYSAKTLRVIFTEYFDSDDSALHYAYQPEAVANVVYANRLGNGDIASGDGWRFRGRGLLRLTGRENYRHCADSIDLNCQQLPDLLSDDPLAAVNAAGWFWQSRQLNTLADKDDLAGIIRKIEGSCHDQGCRSIFLQRAKQAFNIL